MSSETITAEPLAEPKRMRIPREGPLDPEQSIEAFRRALARGDEWYPALLATIGRWSAAEEVVDGIVNRYLIGNEAFDWLLLAQRLLAAVGDAVPENEVERLLVFGIAPEGSDEEEFERTIGAAKYGAHLNFQYGVVIEELLLLTVEQELQKAGRLVGSGGPLPDVVAYEHVYGKTLEELQVEYRSETDSVLGERLSLQELQAFTYWCSKYRVRTSEPARVASDTRKAVALMSRLEVGRSRLGGIRSERQVKVKVRVNGMASGARPTARPRRAKNGANGAPESILDDEAEPAEDVIGDDAEEAADPLTVDHAVEAGGS